MSHVVKAPFRRGRGHAVKNIILGCLALRRTGLTTRSLFQFFGATYYCDKEMWLVSYYTATASRMSPQALCQWWWFFSRVCDYEKINGRRILGSEKWEAGCGAGTQKGGRVPAPLVSLGGASLLTPLQRGPSFVRRMLLFLLLSCCHVWEHTEDSVADLVRLNKKIITTLCLR